MEKDKTFKTNQRPYRTIMLQKNVIEENINDLKDQKMIRNYCDTYSSPVVIVKKKDGSERMCIDYR